MNFKSQICTSVEESKRLLELGLKKETADMAHNKNTIIPKYKIIQVQDWELLTELEEVTYIPAWSMNRLVELLTLCPYKIYPRYNAYDNIINDIEVAIKKGYFYKGYLEEKK
jgi:hypothetical protein